MSDQALRLIEMVAWLSQRDSREPVSYARAAARFGVPADTIRSDLAALARLSDEYRRWLASLMVGVQKDGFTMRSMGPFRRPFRFTPDEVLALAVGLAGMPRGTAIAERFLRTLGSSESGRRPPSPAGRGGQGVRNFTLGPSPSPHAEQVLAHARRARDERRKLDVAYCGSSADPTRRVIQAHQVLHARATWYVYAWCEMSAGWRLFRAERFLEIQPLEQRFALRPDFRPIDQRNELFRAEEYVPTVVRFDPSISRWLAERYPSGRPTADGALEVTFQVADPSWLVREVLQYGDQAEVVSPESMREAVRRVVTR